MTFPPASAVTFVWPADTNIDYYRDAVTGAPVAGEAIVGAWWAYPSSAVLKLGGVNPQVEAISGDVAPTAVLKLGGVVPQLTIVVDATVTVPQAGLALGTVAPTFGVIAVATPAGLVLGGTVPGYALSTILTLTPAGLVLAGTVPKSASRRYITAIGTIEIDLVTDPERELVLVAAGTTDLDLEEVSCL